MTDIPHIDESHPSNMPDGHWIDKCGWEVWVKHGQYHRTDGPAIIWSDGTLRWYQHHKRHRVDGPAVIHPNGTTTWWLNSERYSFNKWLEKNDEITDSQKVLLKLRYG